MKALNKKFGMAHGRRIEISLMAGISSLLNLGYFIAAITQLVYVADTMR